MGSSTSRKDFADSGMVGDGSRGGDCVSFGSARRQLGGPINSIGVPSGLWLRGLFGGEP